MVSPTPANPPGNPIADVISGAATHSPDPAGASDRLLDTFGLHLLILLVGIVMALM